jgi:hypothetical protein
VGIKVLKNRVFRMIFGPKEEGVTVGWRGLHIETRCDLYFPNILGY